MPPECIHQIHHSTFVWNFQTLSTPAIQQTSQSKMWQWTNQTKVKKWFNVTVYYCFYYCQDIPECLLCSRPCFSFFLRRAELSTCMMSEWISWSACSVSCGMGMRSRERYVKQYPEDGSLCQLHTEETEKCVVNDQCCESSFVSCCDFTHNSHEPCSVFI